MFRYISGKLFSGLPSSPDLLLLGDEALPNRQPTENITPSKDLPTWTWNARWHWHTEDSKECRVILASQSFKNIQHSGQGVYQAAVLGKWGSSCGRTGVVLTLRDSSSTWRMTPVPSREGRSFGSAVVSYVTEEEMARVLHLIPDQAFL